MKVVCCKNCGAKYQLDDDDDISTFECSSCAGDLEYLENYSNEEKESNNSLISSRYDNSYIVQCQDCGLKYKIKSSDSILDYECDSCGGSLRYLDEEMNKELDSYLEERRTEIQNIRRESKPKEPTSEELNTNNTPSIKSITNKLENFFSEERMLQIADTEKEEEEIQEKVIAKTARTTIPQSVLSRFGKEFAVPKTNDYDVLKNFLKTEFFKGMEEYYPKNSETKSSNRFLDKISLKEPDNGELTPVETSLINNEPKFDIKNIDVKNMDTNNTIIIIGAVIFILSIIEILAINSGVGIVALFIGVIILCYGIYKTRDVKQTEERTRIIREHLLSLPEEFYVLYPPSHLPFSANVANNH